MKVDLNVRSPTHIGSGDERTVREYLFDDGQAFVPDLRAYFRDHPNEANAFVDAVERNEPMDRIFDDAEQYSRYTLDSSWIDPASIPNKSISVAIKDGRDEPYIPGTSIKGWIRNALAYQALRNGATVDLGGEDVIEKLFRVGNGDPQDDLLRCVTVRDAYPVSEAELAICEIKTYSLSTSGTLYSKSWSNYAECLSLGTEFTTDVSVNETLLRSLIEEHDGDATRVFGDDLSEQGILASISQALQEFQQSVIREDRKLTDDGFIDAFYSNLSSDSLLLRLGFATGHHSKTVATGLLEADRLRENADADTENELKHADCGGTLRRDQYNDERLFCKQCEMGGIQPNFENVIQFPKTRRFVVNNDTPLHLLGWVEASFRGPL